MDYDAMTRGFQRRLAGVLAVVIAVSLLLSTGGAALAQQGNTSGGDSPPAAELHDRAKAFESQAHAAAKLAERQAAQLRGQLERLEAEKQEMQLRLNLIQQQYERIQQQIAHPAVDLESPSIQIFRLRHARAEEIAEMLKQVYGDRLRLAVDQPSNTLIVLSNPLESEATEKLVNTLDAPPEGAPPGPAAERTLQLRILWLVDGLPDDVGTEPDERFVSPMVVDTLHGLGLVHPKIVGQHVTTISMQPERGASFDFSNPVKVGDVSAGFNGHGKLTTVEGDRYRVEQLVQIAYRSGPSSNLSGSMVMPLEHYVVLGTTNYVDRNDDGELTGESFPTAFVVFLQEAPIAPR